MIKFNLICSNDHEFEGWFASNDEFDRLRAAGHLDCAMCGDSKISKALMAPSVQTARKKSMQVDAPHSEPEPDASARSSGEEGVSVATGEIAQALRAAPPEVRERLLQEMRAFKKHVMENAENVGDKFGEEARKIHYGEAPERGIVGKAKLEEVAELLEEEIPVMPLPVLPEDTN